MPPPNRRPVLPQDFVDAYKRERIVRAIAECAHESGMKGLSVDRILQRARMARSTFYGVFPGRDTAVGFACERAAQALAEPIRATIDADCADRVEAAIDALLGVVTAEPLLAELCLVHSHEIGGAAPGPHAEAVIESLREALGGDNLAELAALATVQSVNMQLLRGRASELPEMRDSLMALVAGAQTR